MTAGDRHDQALLFLVILPITGPWACAAGPPAGPWIFAQATIGPGGERTTGSISLNLLTDAQYARVVLPPHAKVVVPPYETRIMPSQHTHPPISIRPPEQLRTWLIAYARQHDRPVRAIVTEALEEYRARHDKEGNEHMRTVTTTHARESLRRAFIWNFMRPDQPAMTPIMFPGLQYRADGTLTDAMKAKATGHLIAVLRDSGYVIEAHDDDDVAAILHHVLWDKWTKDEIGNGRFTGCLFDDYGTIYRGCTADDAANYTVERLAVLGGELRSYTIQEDGVQ
jgi:hypothetical protein